LVDFSAVEFTPEPVSKNHIRSEHWLKATLLYAPTVKRIVPEKYTPEDQPSILNYAKISGPYGALLQTVPAYSPAADDAQQRLHIRLQDHESEIVKRYARSQAPSPDEYWIHTAKFNGTLLSYLVDKNLAWQSHDPGAYGHRTWYALHPILGSAIMTTLGLSIAREQHYDIVTPSVRFHETLLASTPAELFDVLLGEQTAAVRTDNQVRHDLGQLVISLTGVNYQALRPEDIPELQGSTNFVKFQTVVRDAARSIVADGDLREYESGLKSEGQKIINAWHETGSHLSKAIKDALFEGTLVLSGEALKAYLKGTDTAELAISGGVAIGIFVLKARRAFEESGSNPYQYLTEIVENQNQALRLTFPLGLER